MRLLILLLLLVFGSSDVNSGGQSVITCLEVSTKPYLERIKEAPSPWTRQRLQFKINQLEAECFGTV